jgi:hypothetical protein
LERTYAWAPPRCNHHPRRGAGAWAELTILEAKLGEVTGLAMAAQGAGEKVSGLVEDDGLRQTLDRMVDEAKETEDRCTQLADDLDGKKDRRAGEGPRDEAGGDRDDADVSRRRRGRARRLRVPDHGRGRRGGPLEVFGVLGQKAGNSEVQELVEWATPIQQRHFEQVLEGSLKLKLAAEEDPGAEA